MTVTLNIKKYEELTKDEQSFAISINKEFILTKIGEKESEIPKEDLNEFLHNFLNAGFFILDENLVIRGDSY